MNTKQTVVALAAPTGSAPGRLHRIGAWTASHPRKVAAAWLVLLACALPAAGYFSSHLTSSSNAVTGSDSQLATQLINKEFPGNPSETDFAVLHSATLTVQDPRFRRAVTAAIRRYGTSPGVVGTTSPYAAPQRLISPDRRTALIAVGLTGSAKQLTDAAVPLGRLARALTSGQVSVYFTGSSPLAAASTAQAATDLSKAERIGFPAAALVLVVAFGSLVAAAIPLGLGALAVLSALGVLGLASFFAPFDPFVRTAVSMVGIALGIDYSLFIVTRFREELARQPAGAQADLATAVGRTIATAGRAVLFSGSTVIVALTGLWLVRSPRVHSIALGMTAAVVCTMVIAVTLLPAVLGLLGSKINRLALPWARKSLAHPDPEHSAWARLASMVMRRPVAITAAGTLLLAALALPALGLRYGVDLGTSAVANSPAGRGYGVLTGAFPAGTLAPVEVVAARDGGAMTGPQRAAISQFADRVTGDTSLVAGVSAAVSRNGSAVVISASPRGAADSAKAARLVRRLRGESRAVFARTGLVSHVGGSPAQIVDITTESSRAMPLVIAAVLAASWLMLLLVFRSLLLPFKAVVMNLLTCGAAFGAAVLVFQDGYGAALVGASRAGFIQVVLPLFAFALVFGLSMDYEVFMLSRMREEWQRSGDNSRAVRLGITRTARVITAAAAIMVVVFASFMLTRGLEVKQLGFMLALAVLIDATLVRLLLVPAVMRLMGPWNWWLPGWLAMPSRRHSPTQHRPSQRLEHIASGKAKS